MTSPEIRLRPVAPADQPFLRGLYASTRAEEMALVDWDAPALEAFLAMQFDAQALHYRTNHPDGEFSIVLVDGEPAGRIYVDRREREIALLDIVLLPAHRGRGIGTVLVGGLLDEGATSGVPVRLHVERFNASARRLYERLGFRQVEDVGMHILMECDRSSAPRPQLVGARA